MVHDERLVAVEVKFASQVGYLSAYLAVTHAVAQHDTTVGILFFGLAQEGVTCHLGREYKAIDGLVQLGVHVVLLGLVDAVDAHHHASVAVLANAPCHDCHEGILETVHMDDVLPLAQQACKAHRAIDVGHSLEGQDGDGNLQAAVLLEHVGVLAADDLDIEVRVVAQPLHQVIGILLSTGPVLVRNDMEYVNHLLIRFLRIYSKVLYRYDCYKSTK